MSGSVNVSDGRARVLQNLQDLFDLFFVLSASCVELELLDGLLERIEGLALTRWVLFVKVGLGCFQLIATHF
jgi:hypothetical protein